MDDQSPSPKTSRDLQNIEKRTVELLMERTESDDPELRARLFMQVFELNRGLALSYIRWFRHQRFRDDYEAASLEALARAIEQFDPYRGYPFSKYARFNHIRRGVLETVRENEYAAWPMKVFYQRRHVRSAVRKLESQGSEITDELVAELAGCSIEKVRTVKEFERISSSTARIDDVDHLIPNVGMEDAVIRSMQSDEATRALGSLGHRELFVLIRSYGLDGEPTETHQQIGSALGISHEAIRLIEERALSDLRSVLISA